MRTILHFIKYNNAFTLIFMFVFLGFGVSLAASPDVRDAFISSKDIVRSVDNSAILAADLISFDPKLAIKNITEDEERYYVQYSYGTIVIQDYVWQPEEKGNVLKVPKSALGQGDLGSYIAEELGEVIDHETSYLKEVQKLEKAKGETQKVVATEYAGLIGRFLDTKEKEFPGYAAAAAVLQEPVPAPQIFGEFNPQESGTRNQVSEGNLVSQPQPVAAQPGQNAGSIDREAIRQIVEELLVQERSNAQSAEPAPASPAVPAPTPEPAPAPEPAPTPVPSPEPAPVIEEPVVVETESQPTGGDLVSEPQVVVEPVIELAPETTVIPEPAPTPEPAQDSIQP